jgi:hypothetical protein
MVDPHTQVEAADNRWLWWKTTVFWNGSGESLAATRTRHQPCLFYS